MLTLLAALVSPDHFLVAVVGMTFVLGVWLLWPSTDAPVLLLPFGLQWLQVAVKPVHTALTGQPLDDLADFGEPLVQAAYLAIAAIAALAVGMRLGSGWRSVDWSRTLASDASRWPAARLVQIALGFIVGGHLLRVASDFAGPARQTLFSVSNIEYCGLFFLAYWCLSQRRLLGLLALVVAAEIVIGMMGFFADFRTTLFVLIVAAAAARPKISLGGFIGLATACCVLFAATVFWSAIKPEYRSFLNEDTGQQVVLRPMKERLAYIGAAARGFGAQQVETGFDALVSRVSYIDFLGRVIANVPENIPFQNGRQTDQALLHVITPRILFPDKAPTPNDTEITSHYTGMNLDLSGATSISIGYVGELYIDFGYPGSVLGAFLLGLFAGKTFSILRGYNSAPLFLNYGLAVVAALPFASFETALIKVLGSTVAVFLICVTLQRWVIPLFLRQSHRRGLRHAPEILRGHQDDRRA